MQENPVWYKSTSSSCAKWQIWPLTLRKIIWYASTKSTKPWWQERQRRKIVKYYVLNRPMTLFLPCIEMLSNAGFWPRNSSTCNQPKQTHLPNKLERRSKTGIISKLSSWIWYAYIFMNKMMKVALDICGNKNQNIPQMMISWHFMVMGHVENNKKNILNNSFVCWARSDQIKEKNHTMNKCPAISFKQNWFRRSWNWVAATSLVCLGMCFACAKKQHPWKWETWFPFSNLDATKHANHISKLCLLTPQISTVWTQQFLAHFAQQWGATNHFAPQSWFPCAKYPMP